MISGAKNTTQTVNSPSDALELKHGQAQDMDLQLDQVSAGEVTHQWVNEQIKITTEPTFEQIDRF